MPGCCRRQPSTDLWSNTRLRITPAEGAWGAEDPNHHYRKGVPGDWKTYFSPALAGLFKEQYGDLLIKLGYENNLDW